MPRMGNARSDARTRPWSSGRLRAPRSPVSAVVSVCPFHHAMSGRSLISHTRIPAMKGSESPRSAVKRANTHAHLRPIDTGNRSSEVVELQTDVLVIGGGPAGLAAAI